MLGTIFNAFLIDRIGRRKLMLWTLPLMAVFWVMVSVGTSFTEPDRNGEISTIGGYTTIVALNFFVFVFGVGISSTAFAVSAEIFPPHLVGTGNSLGATSNWFGNSLVAIIFKVVSDVNMAARVILYLALGGICIVSYIFVYSFVPETGGKSIEENLNDIIGKGYHEQEQAMVNEEKERK